MNLPTTKPGSAREQFDQLGNERERFAVAAQLVQRSGELTECDSSPRRSGPSRCRHSDLLHCRLLGIAPRRVYAVDWRQFYNDGLTVRSARSGLALTR